MSPRIGLNFNELLKSAIDIVENEGWEVLSISYLAKKLNIQPPSIYNHVKNLNELKSNIALFGVKQLFQKLQESVEGKPEDEAIFSLAFAYLSFARNHPGLYQSTLSVSHTLEEYHLTAEKILQLIFDTLKPYRFNEVESIHIVRGLRSLLHGFASLEKIDGFGIDIPIDESVMFVLKTYLHNRSSESSAK